MTVETDVCLELMLFLATVLLLQELLNPFDDRLVGSLGLPQHVLMLLVVLAQREVLALPQPHVFEVGLALLALDVERLHAVAARDQRRLEADVPAQRDVLLFEHFVEAFAVFDGSIAEDLHRKVELFDRVGL